MKRTTSLWVVSLGLVVAGATARADDEEAPPAGGAVEVETTPPPPQQQAAPQTTVVNNTNTPDHRDAVPRQWHPGLIFGGLAISTTAYAASVIASAVKSDTCNGNSSNDNSSFRIGCRTETWPLYVPFAGPFIQMGFISGSNSQSAYALLAIDGAVQLGGLTMIIVGAALSSRAANKPVRADRIQFSPTFSATGGGMALEGRF